MIKRIKVQAYQSLADVELDLGAITVVTGHSDSGKSALLRAIEDLAFGGTNAEVVTTIAGVRGKEAVVEAELDDGTKVRWIRSAKTAKYELEREGVVKAFSRMSRAVPDEVVDALGIREVQIDSGTGPASWARLQFVGQFDQPFLLIDRGGVAAARILGRLTGVHVFADAIRRSKQDGAALEARRDNLDEQIAYAQSEAAALDGVEDDIVRLEQAQTWLDQAKAIGSQADQIERVLRLIQAAEERLQQIGYDPAEAVELLEALRPSLQSAWVSLGTADRLETLVRQVYGSQTRMAAAVQVMELGVPNPEPIRQLMSVMDKVENAVAKVEGASASLSGKERAFENAVNEAGQLKAQIEAIDATIPICPFRADFSKAQGLYRCRELMKVLNEQEG